MSANPGSDPVLWELDEHGVLTLSFSRPQRRNAWTRELEERYFGHLLTAAADPAVRVIVITGDPAGKAFCPGLDMDVLSRSARGQRPPESERLPHTLLTALPKPTIAAINGACAGLGLMQALCADVRLAASGARLTTAFARRGLPAEHGIAWILTRLIGLGPAADLLLSGRVFDAEEAHALGLVKQVVPHDQLMPTALEYARDLAANCSPGAMAQIKGQLYGGLDTGMEEGRREGVRLLRDERLADDFAEGTASYVDRRPPRFPGIGVDLAAKVKRDDP